MILSGYSSRIFEIKRVPIPDPVPPPREWVSWNPCRQSQDSDSFLTTSKTESTSSAPENRKKRHIERKIREISSELQYF